MVLAVPVLQNLDDLRGAGQVGGMDIHDAVDRATLHLGQIYPTAEWNLTP